jgi:proline dehydrogenase
VRGALIRLSESRRARQIVTRAPGARALTGRFVAGETIEEGVEAAKALNAQGFTVTLDYLGESVHRREEATAAADTYIRLIEAIAAAGVDANVSLKLTQMGQDIDETFLHDNIERVLASAAGHDMFVRFDMESSEYTERTITFFRRLWDEGRRNIGIVLQSYMRRSEDDVRLANQLGARVRLCKGAYTEPPEVAYPEKRDVDANFVRLARLLLSDGTYPGIATHDPAMIRATREWVESHDIPPSAFEFQMLYGVARDAQHELVAAGYNLRVYVPFGEAWYPYLMRRMAERPANLLLIVNAVVRESPLKFLFRRR